MRKSIKYFITVGCGLIIALLVAMSSDLFSQTQAFIIFRILSDSCLVAGVLITGMGLLLFVSNEGAFDGITYGFKVLFQMFKPKVKPVKESYYDYRVARGRNKLAFGFLVICGSAFLVLSIIFTILYSAYI